MKTPPHDYYLKFVNSTVFDEILLFHTKTNFVIHESVKNLAYLHDIPESTLQILTGNELRLYPDMDLTLKNEEIENTNQQNALSRTESCMYFPERRLPFKKIKSLLAPLLTKNDTDYKRGYPSGGALYPVEVFLCNLSEKNTDWPCEEKILHLLPQSKKFEIVQSITTRETIKQAILSAPNEIGSPNIAIIYTAYLPKTIFKYRYRGYRLAQLEAGSMYMLIDLMSKQLGLPSRVWSGYCDNMVCKSIGLNPTLFYPLCVHLIGGEQ